MSGLALNTGVLQEEGIRTTVMPTFTTLLKLGVNPKALIQKRESRLSDYVKVQRCRNNDLKSVDKPVLQGAEDFVALHTQLLEELPSYIANHGKILELALAKFAAVQAKFFDAVRTRMRDYLLLYTPSGTEGDYVKVGMEIEVVNGQKIVEEWIERCRPTVERLEGLRTTNCELDLGPYFVLRALTKPLGYVCVLHLQSPRMASNHPAYPAARLST